MKKLFIAAVAATLFTGCIKPNLDEIIDNTNKDTRPDYTIKFTDRATATGYTQHSLNTSGAAEAEAHYSSKLNSIELKIGYNGPLPNPLYYGRQGNLYTIITFPLSAKPEDIVGVYEFPAANSKLDLRFFYAANGDTIKRSLPDYGKLEVNYNAATKTLYGKADNICFFQRQYGNAATDELYIKFNHVALK